MSETYGVYPALSFSLFLMEFFSRCLPRVRCWPWLVVNPAIRPSKTGHSVSRALLV
jgi:hypothetical protein